MSFAQGEFTVPDDGEQRRYGIFDKKKIKQQEADQKKVNSVIYGDKKSENQKKVSNKPAIDEKYLVGACPEVNGKVQWEKVFEVPGMSASQMYDKMLAYLKTFVKEKEQTEYSKVAVVNESQKQIGVSVVEWLVFENKPLSLDRTKFCYKLIVSCYDGKCHAVIRNISYIYDEERGGGQFPAEDMISDAQALNKAKNGFQKGGSKKFRTKTIDRKDEIFVRLAQVLDAK